MRNLIDMSKMSFRDYMEELKPCLFENEMSGGGLDGYHNYIGPDWAGWFCGPGMNRDSDILQESNFETALAEFGGEIEGQVEVREVSHWACGWFKQIMVKADKSNLKNIKVLYDIKCALEQYPVLDDSDFSEREYKSYSDYAEQTKQEIADSLLFLIGLDDGSIHWTKDSEDLSPELLEMRKALESEASELGYYLQLEHQMQRGPDSALGYFRRWELEESKEGLERFNELFEEYSETFQDLQNLGFHDSLAQGELYQILNSIFLKRGE